MIEFNVLRNGTMFIKSREKLVFIWCVVTILIKLEKNPVKQKPVVKTIKYYWQLRTKLYNRPKKNPKYTPWLSKEELFFRRVDLY